MAVWSTLLSLLPCPPDQRSPSWRAQLAAVAPCSPGRSGAKVSSPVQTLCSLSCAALGASVPRQLPWQQHSRHPLSLLGLPLLPLLLLLLFLASSLSWKKTCHHHQQCLLLLQCERTHAASLVPQRPVVACLASASVALHPSLHRPRRRCSHPASRSCSCSCSHVRLRRRVSLTRWRWMAAQAPQSVCETAQTAAHPLQQQLLRSG